MGRFVDVTYDRARRFAHVQYATATLATPADVEQFRDEVESQMRALGVPMPLDVVVNLGRLTVKPAVAALYDEARRRLLETTARRAYRYQGSGLVRTRILTSSTLHRQSAHLYASFEEALRALEADRARDGEP